jgi:hypothetical protein
MGDIMAIEPSYLTWTLNQYSGWTGRVAMPTFDTMSPHVDIFIDNTSNWTLTNESWVQTLSSANPDLSNIFAPEGVVLHYNASSEFNGYLQGKNFDLVGGGSAMPY